MSHSPGTGTRTLALHRRCPYMGGAFAQDNAGSGGPGFFSVSFFLLLALPLGTQPGKGSRSRNQLGSIYGAPTVCPKLSWGRTELPACVDTPLQTGRAAWGDPLGWARTSDPHHVRGTAPHVRGGALAKVMSGSGRTAPPYFLSLDLSPDSLLAPPLFSTYTFLTNTHTCG